MPARSMISRTVSAPMPTTRSPSRTLYGGAASVVRYKRCAGCACEVTQTRVSIAVTMIGFKRIAHPSTILPAGSDLCI